MPGNHLFLTRNEQVSGSSPLVGSSFCCDLQEKRKSGRTRSSPSYSNRTATRAWLSTILRPQLEPILFILVVGEEIGWRGYALPRLLATRSMLSASLILGVLWGAWHLPTFFIPGLPQHSIPFSAFMLLTIAYSVLFTWMYVRTAGSVLIATLFHGSINFCQGFFLGGIDPAREYWLLAFVWWVAALVVLVGTGTTFVRRPQNSR